MYIFFHILKFEIQKSKCGNCFQIWCAISVNLSKKPHAIGVGSSAFFTLQHILQQHNASKLTYYLRGTAFLRCVYKMLKTLRRDLCCTLCAIVVGENYKWDVILKNICLSSLIMHDSISLFHEKRPLQ